MSWKTRYYQLLDSLQRQKPQKRQSWREPCERRERQPAQAPARQAPRAIAPPRRRARRVRLPARTR